MKKLFIAVAALAMGCDASLAQNGQAEQQSSDRGAAATRSEAGARPATGMGSKTMASCREDTRKYCANATDYMHKECLVKNWDFISGDCQDALGIPFDGAPARASSGN